ncbi:MAG TPA: hypothetical protein VES36_02395 [Candidatus Limnocylindrales bacterium]|nr:hypothetical protein [Candidatus Limnocylindrales bacterium]
MVERLRKTFLVEAYVPQLDDGVAAEVTARLRSAADALRASGSPVEWLGAFAVQGDETLFSVVGAENASQVGRLTEDAGLSPAHIAEVLTFAR